MPSTAIKVECIELPSALTSHVVRCSTDVLRMVYTLCGLPSDLVVPRKVIYDPVTKKYIINNPYKEFRLKSIPRFARRYLLSLLEELHTHVDMLHYQTHWKLAEQILHPGDYANQFPKTHNAFKNIHTSYRAKTWYGTLENAKTLTDYLHIASQIPMELAKRLDMLVRNNPDRIDQIFDALYDVSHSIPLSALCFLAKHFKKRDVVLHRSIISSGYTIELPPLQPLPQATIDKTLTRLYRIIATKTNDGC